MGTRKFRRNRYCFRIAIIAVLIVATVLGLLVLMRKEPPSIPLKDISKKQVPKVAHISIDDATMIFQDIWWHGYDSIFDNEILDELQQLHEEYGIKVTLYVFGELEGFAMWDFPLTYKKEFVENADWLRLGFHSGADCDPKEDYSSLKDFKEDYERVERTLRKLAGDDGVTPVLRLHNWYATEEMVTYLQEQGNIALLCRDDKEASYNLTEEQMEELYSSRDGKLETEEMTYYATDLRLEKTEDITDSLEVRKNDRIIIIFTHAWSFEDSSGQLEEAVQWLWDNGYQFSDLESVVEE